LAKEIWKCSQVCPGKLGNATAADSDREGFVGRALAAARIERAVEEAGVGLVEVAL
jgi:hypothetical protein